MYITCAVLCMQSGDIALQYGMVKWRHKKHSQPPVYSPIPTRPSQLFYKPIRSQVLHCYSTSSSSSLNQAEVAAEVYFFNWAQSRMEIQWVRFVIVTKVHVFLFLLSESQSPLRLHRRCVSSTLVNTTARKLTGRE